MEGFRDPLARQYEALLNQTPLEPTIEEPSTPIWLAASNDDFLTPIHSEMSHAGNWLELGEYNEEAMLPSKGTLTLVSVLTDQSFIAI
jgi:hypothetical protein